MTCLPETDYFRELDFLDFPTEEKLFPQPTFPPTYFNTPSYYAPQVHQPQQHYYTQRKADDLFAALDLDAEDREILGSLNPIQALPARNSSCDTLEVFDYQAPNQGGLKRARQSEESATLKKPKLEFPPSELTSYDCENDSSSSSLKYKTKQKRTKWLKKEVQALWEGIAMYGNNWRLIKKKAFGHRTYYQVKDKGRRILSSQGWSSGRTKATHDGASEEAKVIAEKVLVSTVKVEMKSDEVSVVAGSTSSPSIHGDTDLDFDIDFDCAAL